MSYVFCLFTCLYRRFRLSRVSQSIDLDEIYRLVSKILNFTPCGSVFARFCVFYCINRFPKIRFAIEPCRREVLGRPVARIIRPFLCFCLVRGSCARVLCASLVCQNDGPPPPARRNVCAQYDGIFDENRRKSTKIDEN